jgi:hypothetical protein
MTEPGINRLPQRIDDKIGRLVREGGRQRPCRPERNFNLSQCGTQLSVNHTGERETLIVFPRFQENLWFRSPGLAPAAFPLDEGWQFLRPCRP